MNMQRLSFLTVVLGAAAAGFVGCDTDSPVEPIIEDPPPVVDPEDQEVVISNVRPPAVSGGTLIVSRDGLHAIAADPDRDRVVVVDLAKQDVIAKIALQEGDEPGRVAEDSEGRVHVALRRGGALLTLDPATWSVAGRRSVCASPRGVATFKPIEGGEETVVVACASGEVVEIEAAPTGKVVSTTQLEPDLRDVVVSGDGTAAGRKLLVSSFRSAEVLTIGPTGVVQNRSKPQAYSNIFTERMFLPNVAWKMIPAPGGAAMIHQRAAMVPVVIEEEEPDGYGGQVFDCGSTITNAAVSRFDSNGNVATSERGGGIGPALLPVDVALSDEASANWGERQIAMIGAGNDQLMMTNWSTVDQFDACDDNFFQGFVAPVGPEPIALDFGPTNVETGARELVVQLREPAALVIYDGNTLNWRAEIALGGDSRADSGHTLFHRNPEQPTTIACASCHPEGGDDGHTWLFTEIGERRTQSLYGDITGTEPFHWDGDLNNLEDVMTTVFEHRMGGSPQSEARVDALHSWLATIPRIGLPEQVDSTAIARGKALFESTEVGCATCHSGAKLTNNKTMSIGKGAATQVPSLVGVRNRAPFMHDGCAKTLKDRFEPNCGGTEHGDVSGLSDAEIDDIVAYMNSL
ncbi:MAG: c-type cytochrome [Polyangiaceae bacterium]|nr:c-type cytochrome [Polyangiaceae bacterium]